jgi:transcriptional regulator with XRE-family HTH domain
VPTQPETAPLDPQALRYAREQKQMSKRELGRRVAKHLDRSPGAVRMQLSKIERGDAVSEEDRELLDALAEELAVGVDELGRAPLWIWVRVHGGRPGIVELAMRMIAFSSPEAAFHGRDLLAHASKARFTPFKDASLVPMRPDTLFQDVLDENYPDLNNHERGLLVGLDPNEDLLSYYAVLNEFINTEEPTESQLEAIVEIVDKFKFVGEIVELHELATRRLARVPVDDDGLLGSWVLREVRLNQLLDRLNEFRHERREQTLAGLGVQLKR